MMTEHIELVFANFPTENGSAADLLSGLPAAHHRAPVFVRDRNTTIDDALCLAKMGIEQLLGNQVDIDEVVHRIDICLSDRREKRKAADLSQSPWRRSVVGQSRAMDQVAELIALVAARRCTVLITGETGTGKEVAARAIHLASPRSDGPFVAVNCSALPENLLEAELFGHVKGAFTGAQQLRIGRFEQANQGTLFLDEIGDMPLELQTKLLRVLQEREFERLGSSETIRVDVRIIAATNIDLRQLVAQGRFRQDLFYRLNVVPIQMPALRARTGDIPALTEHFVVKVCRDESLPLKSVSREAMQSLVNRNWPGNVRQLENAVEMAIVMSGNRAMLETSDFPAPEHGITPPAQAPQSLPEYGMDFEQAVIQFERNILSQALRKTHGNKKQAADMLGLKRTTLSAKVRILEAAGGLLVA